MVSRLYCGLHLARSHIDVSRTSHLSQDQACACLTWITETRKILQWHRPREKFHLLSLKNSQKHTSICNVLDVSPRTIFETLCAHACDRGQVADTGPRQMLRSQTTLLDRLFSPRTSLARGQVAGVVHPADKRGQTRTNADKPRTSRSAQGEGFSGSSLLSSLLATRCSSSKAVAIHEPSGSSQMRVPEHPRGSPIWKHPSDPPIRPPAPLEAAFC